MNRYIIDSRTRLELTDILDALQLILEPDRGHKASTDTVGLWPGLTHSRLGISIREAE